MVGYKVLNLIFGVLNIFVLILGLIQRLKNRERDRIRVQRQRSRDSPRALNYEAPPFYMPSDASSESTSEGTSHSTLDAANRRQLGERLYPKVFAQQPVSISL